MFELGWTKQEVLQQIYIREVPLVIAKLGGKRRREELQRLYGLQEEFYIALATAGMSPSQEMVDSVSESIKSRIQNLEGVEPSSETEEEPPSQVDNEKGFKQLEELQQFFAQSGRRGR